MLNALTVDPDRTAWDTWDWGTAAVDGVDWPILWAPEAVARVAAAHRSGRAEVRWLTTWGSAADDELAALLGLPPLTVAGEPPSRGGLQAGATSHAEATGLADGDDLGRWWKADVVRRVVAAEPDRPLVWTDDDLASEPWAAAWVGGHAARSLCLPPDPRVGLSPDDLDRVDAFLAAG